MWDTHFCVIGHCCDVFPEHFTKITTKLNLHFVEFKGKRFAGEGNREIVRFLGLPDDNLFFGINGETKAQVCRWIKNYVKSKGWTCA